MSLVSVVCCQVEVSATGWSLVQRSPTESGVSNVCDREVSIRRRPWPTRGLSRHGEKIIIITYGQCKIFGFQLVLFIEIVTAYAENHMKNKYRR
jgi:hypothetical protein